MKHLSSYEKCSRTNSHSTHPALRLIKLFFREVEPHYISTTWESLYPIPWEILQQLLTPSIFQAPCFHCSKESESLVLISPVVGKPALILLPWAAVAGFYAAYLIVSQCMRKKHFSYRLDESRSTRVNYPACVAGLHLQTTFESIGTVSASFSWSPQTEYRIRGLTGGLGQVSSGPQASFCQRLYWSFVHDRLYEICDTLISHVPPTSHSHFTQFKLGLTCFLQRKVVPI